MALHAREHGNPGAFLRRNTKIGEKIPDGIMPLAADGADAVGALHRAQENRDVRQRGCGDGADERPGLRRHPRRAHYGVRRRRREPVGRVEQPFVQHKRGRRGHTRIGNGASVRADLQTGQSVGNPDRIAPSQLDDAVAALRQQPADGLDNPERQQRGRTLPRAQPPHDNRPRQCRRHLRNRFRPQCFQRVRLRQSRVRLRLQDVGLRRKNRLHAGQHRHGGRTEDGFECRHQMMAHAVSQGVIPGIRRIFPPGFLPVPQQIAKVRMAFMEKGTQQFEAGRLRGIRIRQQGHTGNAPQRGAAANPQKEQLRLIIHRMRERNGFGTAPDGHAHQRFAPQSPGRHFHGFAGRCTGGRHINAFAQKRHALFFGGGFDERGIGKTLRAAQPVLHVPDRQPERAVQSAFPGPKSNQTMKQGHGIRPAGNRDQQGSRRQPFPQFRPVIRLLANPLCQRIVVFVHTRSFCKYSASRLFRPCQTLSMP